MLKLDGTSWTVWAPSEGDQVCDPRDPFQIEQPIPGAVALELDAERISRQLGTPSTS